MRSTSQTKPKKNCLRTKSVGKCISNEEEQSEIGSNQSQRRTKRKELQFESRLLDLRLCQSLSIMIFLLFSGRGHAHIL
jgi:hypothetical protein